VSRKSNERIGLLGALSLTLAGCPLDGGDPESAGNPYETPRTYFSTMTALVVEVAYETGAEPYTGIGLGQPLWDFLKSNLAALFQGRATVPNVSVPVSLTEMQSLPTQNKTTWTAADLLNLARVRRTGTSTAATGDFFVAFLNGYFDVSGSPDLNVLGVLVGGTTVMALFKPVIESAAAGELPYVGKYVEQTTLVHEMGHALGLVNYGLPLTAAHQDTANGAHCTNLACVMYWQIEGVAAARQFVKRDVLAGNEVMFGSECLTDARSYVP